MSEQLRSERFAPNPRRGARRHVTVRGERVPARRRASRGSAPACAMRGRDNVRVLIATPSRARGSASASAPTTPACSVPLVVAGISGSAVTLSSASAGHAAPASAWRGMMVRAVFRRESAAQRPPPAPAALGGSSHSSRPGIVRVLTVTNHATCPGERRPSAQGPWRPDAAASTHVDPDRRRLIQRPGKAKGWTAFHLPSRPPPDGDSITVLHGVRHPSSRAAQRRRPGAPVAVLRARRPEPHVPALAQPVRRAGAS